MVELLLKMVYMRTTISEVPMTLDTSLRAGKSKMNVTRTIWGYLRLWQDTQRWRAAAVNVEARSDRRPRQAPDASAGT